MLLDKMVRVVSCHHFVSQDVFLSENEPVAFSGAQDKLLVSTVQHAVNVHDLDARGSVLHSFPTVDIVKQIIYCEAGNYVATVENKVSRHRSPVSYVRVYFNWWIDTNGQPMKVRIAGNAPAFDNSLNKTFEMVELPLEKSALCIASCRKTSALAVSLGNVVSVFCYATKVHQRQTFNDFDHFADISVPFIVRELDMCEGYFACMSDRAVHVFQVCCKGAANELEDSMRDRLRDSLEDSLTDSLNDPMKNSLKDPVDSDVYDENYVEWRFESCGEDGSVDKDWEAQLKSKLDPSSFPINLHFHAIDKENETFKSNEECEFLGPLLTVRGCSVDVRLDSKVFEMFPSLSANVYAVTLLFRQFKIDDNNSKLSSLQLVPFYKSEPLKEGFEDPLNAAMHKLEQCAFSLPWSNLVPGTPSPLQAIGCFFSSLKEGFLYSISGRPQFVSSYLYTSTLKGVVVDASLLHALTETGLETYTVHLPLAVIPQLEKVDGIQNAVPEQEDSVCLLGLRPFLGVDHLVKSDNHLVLVSSVEDSVANPEPDGGNRSTLYSLKEPDCIQVYLDLLEVAEIQKSSNPDTYYHLLSEAHMILRTQMLMEKHQGNREIEKQYRKSCLMLGDYFLCQDVSNQKNSIPYFHLSQLSAENVLKRILDARHQAKEKNASQILASYMDSILFRENPTQSLTFPQATADAILSAYFEGAPEMVWKVILCSDLKGYKIDKAILILKKRMTNKKHPLSPISNAADTTALVYLLLQKGNAEVAQSMIMSLAKADLLCILSSIYSKLWEGKKVSQFGKFMQETRPDAFIELLLSYVEGKVLEIPEILQILQSESPNCDLHCVPLLKEFLEALLSDKSMAKNAESSVLNLLLKIYLKRLIEPLDKSATVTSNSYNSMNSFTLFFSSRATWLNEMPPFNGKGISRTCLLSAKKDVQKVNDSDISTCCCWTCNEDLLRLQSFLSYVGPPEDMKGLVLDFLCSAKDKLPNWLSLEVMCSSEARAVKLLIGMAPKAVLPYATETFKGDDRKWSMLFTFLHEHVLNIPEDHPNIEVYSQAFHAVLGHLAESLSPVELLSLLPRGERADLVPHVRRCVEKHQANRLRLKIVSLGQEIKSMMLP